MYSSRMPASTRRGSPRSWPRSRRRAGRSGGTRRSRPARNSTTRSTAAARAPPVRASSSGPRLRSPRAGSAAKHARPPTAASSSRCASRRRACRSTCGRIHTTDLDGWDDDPASPPFQEVLRALGGDDRAQRPQPGRRRLAPAPRPRRRASLARLDLRSAVRQHERRPEQEYFSDGISEDIITDLSKVSALSVVARNTAFTLQGQARRHRPGRAAAQGQPRARGQRAQGRRPRAHHRAADRRRDRRPRLGRALRPRPQRHLRAAGRDLRRPSSRR